VPDEVYNLVRTQFSAEELVNLTFAITNINAWNRLCISFRVVPGDYQPTVRKAG
jgi:alkylhydroperoxidase family enzyme